MRQVDCPNCRKQLGVPDVSTNLKVRCRACNHIFMVSPEPQGESSKRGPGIGWPATVGLGIFGIVAAGLLVYVVLTLTPQPRAGESSVDLDDAASDTHVIPAHPEEELDARSNDWENFFPTVRTAQSEAASPAVDQGVAAKKLTPDKLFAKCSPAVVRVVVRDKEFNTIGMGSGFFVSSDGLLVTNFHVIEEAESVTVLLSSNASFEVDGVAATDKQHDLALLKIKASDVPFLTLSRAGPPAVGTQVFAIGNPRGLTNTLSDGLVSALRKDGERVSLIQTTAAISPGSSGGPLLTGGTLVVGVTTSYIEDGQNLNFAVPVRYVRDLIARRGEELMQDLRIAPLDPRLARPQWWLQQAMDELRATSVHDDVDFDRFLDVARLQSALGDEAQYKIAIDAAALSLSAVHDSYRLHDVRERARLRNIERNSPSLLRLQIEVGDVDGAFSTVRFVESLGFPRREAYALMAYRAMRIGDRKTCQEVIDRLAREAESERDRVARGEAYSLIAMLHANAGDFEDALRVADALQDIEGASYFPIEGTTILKSRRPLKTQVLARIAWHQIRRGDIEGAKRTMRRIQHPSSTEWLEANLIMKLVQDGDIERAYRLVTSTCKEITFQLEVAKTRLLGNDNAGAVESLRLAEKAAAQLPEEAKDDTYSSIARLRARAGDLRGALAAAERTSDKLYGRPFAFLFIAEEFVAAGDFQTALLVVRKHLTPVDGTPSDGIFEQVAVQQANGGDIAAALQTLEDLEDWLASKLQTPNGREDWSRTVSMLNSPPVFRAISATMARQGRFHAMSTWIQGMSPSDARVAACIGAAEGLIASRDEDVD